MKKKYMIGYTSGVFDMFHIGHLNILKHARSKCDYLIVGVSTDEVVEAYKQKRPVIPFEQRLEIVKAIRYVDAVVPQTTMNKIAMWEEVHFDVMFHGDEWKGTDLYVQYEKDLAEVGVKIVYINHTKGISSSLLRNRINK